MRLIVEVFGRAWMLSANLQHAKVLTPGDHDDEDDEEFKQIPPDPHGVAHSHIEHGPGADCYTHDVVARRFGFHVSKK